ncbi:hypothetical protein [Mycoplasma leonicaptivi]|uniref:hypothetical protein n=1 Tax=Mycoplasma leonicaptivi TaxID=36742 RepID=UPI0004846BD6|nr:hypothetical protein [Mycoplasma leonicaptivi]
MKNKNRNLYKLYFKLQFSTKKFYIVSLSFFLVFWLITIIDFLIKKENPNYQFVDSLALSSIILFIINLFAVGLSIGLFAHTIQKIRLSSENFRKRSENSRIKSMSQTEKIVYEKEKANKQNYEIPEQIFIKKSKFSYYFNFIIYTVVFVTFIILQYT